MGGWPELKCRRASVKNARRLCFRDKDVKMNDICRLSLRTTKPVLADSYRKNRQTGSLILVEEGTNETVAAGMII